MKHRLCIFAAFAALILLAGCRRIVLPEEEPEAGGDSYNSEAPVVDRDSEEDSGMAGVMTEKGSYHGYETLADYLNVFGSPDRPIPMEDVLPGGCLYTLIMQEARISSILNCWVEGFVVGYVNGTTWSKMVFGTDAAVASNIVLAARPDETDPSRCFPIQLSQATVSQKEMRAVLNLADNPEMLHVKVCLAGFLTYYMHTLGLTQTYNGYYDDGSDEDDPSVPDDPDDSTDSDDPDDSTNPDDPVEPTGPYHGYNSPAAYLTAFSQSYDTPAPFEDFLEGGCVYQDVANGKKSSEWKKRPLWIRGFIVGYVYGAEMSEAVFDISELQKKRFSNANIIIAQQPDETDYHRCIPIELPSKSQIRNTYDLKTHPELLGTEVAVKGKVERYFCVAGLKSPSDYHTLSE